ncbi:nucleotidyltransferase family protein [Mucilaginibacter terrae]|uniref:Molybdenum cofactor cytidylyltransferase n=1 Tax=Mucilaginibacter terrae TaxID=1955052 RepID=A0ABU3GTM5_9SPHI|nr:nucleotidyltransferase family protein [Mucilaginibacter terrae]MDT3403125.1 molybdenum cofactor cytidylyltransferase [Mucilaginibacter terrae]
MTGIIILAAGASTRMGKPKQQLIYEQKTLLQRSIDAALGISNAIVYVVLGANAEVIKLTIEHLPVNIIYNDDWESGMSSSIKAGITALSAYPDVDDALLMLCDQPFVDAALLKQLIGLKTSAPSYIIACGYSDTIGVPALFSKNHFSQLLALTGNEGAKKLLMQQQSTVITLPFIQGSIDIDTPDDLKRLKKGQL